VVVRSKLTLKGNVNFYDPRSFARGVARAVRYVIRARYVKQWGGMYAWVYYVHKCEYYNIEHLAVVCGFDRL
jgi:hypothetical protein